MDVVGHLLSGLRNVFVSYYEVLDWFRFTFPTAVLFIERGLELICGRSFRLTKIG